MQNIILFHKMEIPNIVMLTPEGRNYPDGSWNRRQRRERERKAKKQSK